MKYIFRDEAARRAMVLISKHFIENENMSVDKFWEIMAMTSKSFKEDDLSTKNENSPQKKESSQGTNQDKIPTISDGAVSHLDSGSASAVKYTSGDIHSQNKELLDKDYASTMNKETGEKNG